MNGSSKQAWRSEVLFGHDPEEVSPAQAGCLPPDLLVVVGVELESSHAAQRPLSGLGLSPPSVKVHQELEQRGVPDMLIERVAAVLALPLIQ